MLDLSKGESLAIASTIIHHDEEGKSISLANIQIAMALTAFRSMFDLPRDESPELVKMLSNHLLDKYSNLTGTELVHAFKLYAENTITIDNQIKYIKSMNFQIIDQILRAYKKYKFDIYQEIKKKVHNESKQTIESAIADLVKSSDSVKKTVKRLYQIFIDGQYDSTLYPFFKNVYLWLTDLKMVRIDKEERQEVYDKATVSAKEFLIKKHGLVKARNKMSGDDFKKQREARYVSMIAPVIFARWKERGVTMNQIDERFKLSSYLSYESLDLLYESMKRHKVANIENKYGFKRYFDVDGNVVFEYEY